MTSNELFNRYVSIIYGGNVDELRAFYHNHPLPPDCDTPEISNAITTDLKKVTVEMHRTVIELGLIAKTDMKHLVRAIYHMFEETELHVDMLIRTMDAATIRDFRTKEGETVIWLICIQHLNPISTMASAIIKYLDETIEAD